MTYVGKHRRPEEEQPEHRSGDTDTLRLKIRRRWEWTRPGYPPIYPDLYTHPGQMHRMHPDPDQGEHHQGQV